MHPSVRVCGVSVRAPVKGVRGRCARRNYRLVACFTPYSSAELRKMRKEVLVKELNKHDLDTKGTKAQLIERIQTHVTNKASESPPPENDPLSGRTEKGLMRKKRTWLVEECEKRGLATNGKKLTLIKRLQEYIEKKESMSTSDLKKAVDEMQNLVAENGIKIKQRAERIVQKLQSNEEQDFPKVVVDQEQESDDDAKEQEDHDGVVKEPSLDDLADVIPDVLNIVTVFEHFRESGLEKLVKDQLRAYFSLFVPGLSKKSLLKREMIELITAAYKQETESDEKVLGKLIADKTAEMMAMDQLKLDTGVFVGDMEQSIDNLISEMRTEYGKHIPVELEEPVSYLSEEELEELEKIAEQDFSLETPVEEELNFTDDEYPESPMGGPDVDERDLMNGRDELFQADDDQSMKLVSGTRHRHGERKTQVEKARNDAVLQFEKYIEENKVDFKVATDESAEQDSLEATETVESPVLDEKSSVETGEDTEATQSPVLDETVSPVLEEKESPVLEEKTVSPVLEEKTESPVLEEKTVSPVLEEKTESPVLEEKTVSPVLEETESSVLEEESVIEKDDDTVMELSPVLEVETDIKTEEDMETMQSPVLEQKETPVLEDSKTTVEAEEGTEVEENPVLAEQDTTALAADPDISVPDTSMETQEIPKAELKDTVKESDSAIDSTEPVLEEDTVVAQDPESITEPTDPVVMETEDSSSEDEITVIDQIPVVDSQGLIDEVPVEEAPVEVDPVVGKMDPFALKEAVEKIFATHAHKELLKMSDEAFLTVVKPLNMDISPIRTEFIAKLAELAAQELPETKASEDNLVELSLSKMDDENPILEAENEIEDELLEFHPTGFFDKPKETTDSDLDDDDQPDTDEIREETVERPLMKVSMTSLPKMDDLDNLNTPKITQVLNELRSQRSEWEETTKDLLQFIQEKCDAEQQPQKRADLMKDIEALTEEYEDLKERVNEKDEEVEELQSKINRVIFEFDLLSSDIIIGDGSGEFGPLTTFPVDSFTDLRLSANDDFSLNYHLDTAIQDSTVVFDPSDPQILDQLNSNFNAAADSELFLRNFSDEEELSPPKEQPSKTDPMKKHSSIGVPFAAAVSEIWNFVTQLMEPRKERDEK